MVETFSISLTTLKRWLRMSREGNDLSPGVSTGRTSGAHPRDARGEEGPVGAQLEENDDATLERHCERWEERRGV